MLRSIIFSSIFTALLSTGASAAENTANTVPQNTSPASDPAKTIIVTPKTPQFTITLASNPTTGYSWLLYHYNPFLVQIVKHVYRPPTSTLVGAGGTDIWIFKLKPAAFAAPQITKISLIHARPWNVKDNPSKITFMVVSSTA